MMLRIICLLLTVILSFPAKAQTALKSQELGFARSYAKDFLVGRGVDDDNINLQVEEYTDHLVFFNDMRNNIFLLMVRDDYSSLLTENVLAFSIGTSHSKARENETFMLMMNYYDGLIKKMHDGLLPKERPTEVEHLRIMPMMGNIRWRQFGLRDIFEGQHGSVLSGCGAVAVGQLMAYYCWPDTIRHDFKYYDKQGRLLDNKLNGTQIVWKDMKNIYFFHDKDSDSLAPLMKIVGTTIMSDYGANATNSHSRNMKRALTTHFGYSPEMYYVTRDEVSENTMMHLIYNELQAGRPCVLSGGNHHFVCDGAFDGFLHLNMGWSGSYDGWYRFPMVSDVINPKAFIETALLNIIPQEKAGKDTMVTLQHAGTLANVLLQEDLPAISKLKVNGPINGEDIRLLRRMAGNIEPQDFFSWKGKLTNLDLTDAKIVGDSTSFYDADAKKLRYSYYKSKDELFNFTSMTHEQWLLCHKELSHNKRTFYITEDIPDSLYTMHFNTQNNNISCRMFEGCTNLQYIYLPSNTQYIEFSAFRRCSNLREIRIPATVRVMQDTFIDCHSLEKLYVCEDAPYLNGITKRLDDMRNNRKRVPVIEVDSSLGRYADAIAAQRQSSSDEQRRKANEELYKKYQNYPTKFISRYKMVNGKKVLIKRTPIK